MAEGRDVQWVEVSEGQVGQRIDNFLRTRLKGAPKSLIYRIVRKGEIRVNKKRVKADYRLELGDLVRIPPLRLAPEEAVREVSDGLRNLLAGSVLVEGPDWLVINKPAGLAVHGGSGVKIGLIEALRQVRDDLDFLELVHRLDRDTSGCLLLAKSRTALVTLNQALKAHQMDKQYLALVQGRWPTRREFVSARLDRFDAGNGERRVRVDSQGKVSRTRFAVREAFSRVTLIEAEPVTGRTHQIRVHAAHAGHALLGDDKYGTREGARLARELKLERLFLHSNALTFPEPSSGRPVHVKAPLGETLEGVLARARQAR
ncbi:MULTISPECIES: RluA family pseudouridine synthase [Chromohalobacter]|jgi:23S rRNA pseudouridine955/2504/2580 synthase|uniref:RluA family pseudouridine synthase n=1 Tax=Chromohalobacter TaxID=42054 RepID=UPI0005520531|nr:MULTISPECIES: RluA family pseudouridine synthase [Chromohalobacter]MBZ5876739.1 RluA family pseudouridine synthase [Chromohalobacter salexigens]MDF9434809.1 RluA family pseudouridine synthase [Chromohalobacter israelensis]NWO57787.1 RluA family pseudouridine synthase [Chromohalobacter salexigens]RXE48057.1 23S rRNA pseudouridine(955/2504/2580) synthase [Chromohalobacter salexigens]